MTQFSQLESQLSPQEIQFFLESQIALRRYITELCNEVRPSLNLIVGWSEVMLEGKLGSISPEQKEALDSIHKSGIYFYKVFEDLLDVHYGLNFEHWRFKFEEVDLKILLPEAISACQEHWVIRDKKKVVEIEQILPENLPIIWTDKVRIRLAITGVLITFISAAYEKAKIKLTVEDDNNNKQVVVHIDGKVSSSASFHTSNNPRLFLSRTITEKLNGQFQLSSKDEETTVILKFPIHQESGNKTM